MLLRADRLAEMLETSPIGQPDPLVITPLAELPNLKKAGSASIDLRLGTWIATPRITRLPFLHIGSQSPDEPEPLSMHYVAFGAKFYLHPRNFILASTLEWIRLPRNLAGYITGKSSWGRRGLITATAAGVHPGFAGCLALELTNLGEVPIELQPGMRICQLFLHETTEGESVDESSFVGFRRPVLGRVERDKVAEALGKDRK